MATQSKKRKFVADGVFYAELNEVLMRELAEDGYSGVEVRVTPMRTEIIIRATRTQNVLGEKGRRIRELTSVVQKRFKFPENGVELYAEKVNNRGLCAIAQAESLRYKLLGGLAVRRYTMFWTQKTLSLPLSLPFLSVLLGVAGCWAAVPIGPPAWLPHLLGGGSREGAPRPLRKLPLAAAIRAIDPVTQGVATGSSRGDALAGPSVRRHPPSVMVIESREERLHDLPVTNPSVCFRACYGVLRFIMESGAKGCEVIVSGKLRAQRAKSMKFKDGYMISSGQPVNEYIDSAVRHVLLRQGVLGIKVKIMLDWDPKGKQGPMTPLPDLVTIHTPKDEDELIRPSPVVTTEIDVPGPILEPAI
ncbi:hypothetical protein Taro_052836 [Colocasia esculenta]|uniref:30S ribosomal protein S3, chloroplastic n=1 Tax=Colocasia esculenta TaxID=4460 RepID=A0A843XKV7_COLES|nr:hypothetical protein [Colocasia esculenta]